MTGALAARIAGLPRRFVFPKRGPLDGLTPDGWDLEAAVRPMAKVSPFKFLQEVRAEAQKVTWPTRRETAITTAMVFVMVAVASIFFLLADQVMRFVVTLVLGIGG
jgi:preprotein translocase subunit SecE